MRRSSYTADYVEPVRVADSPPTTIPQAILGMPAALSPLERAAVSYVAAKEDFDACRYAFKPWKSYELAWRRLKAEVARAVAVEAAEKATSK